MFIILRIVLMVCCFCGVFSFSLLAKDNNEKVTDNNPLSAENIFKQALPQSNNVEVAPDKGCACERVSHSPIPESFSQDKSMISERFDWLRLTSDEWLKGDILSLYDEELEFDSDELGLLTLDWSDIAELYTKGAQSIRIIDGTVMEGWIVMKDKTFTVLAEGERYEFDPISVMTIASSEKNRREMWDGEINFGADVSAGNTQSVDYTFSAYIQRRTANNRLKLSYVSNFSENRAKGSKVDVETANSQRFTAIYDIYYSGNIYLRAVDFEYFKDPFQNIDSRNTLGVAIGYPLQKDEKVEWDITAGPGYQQTAFSTVSADSSDHERSMVVTLGSTYEYEVTKNIDIESEYQVQFVNEESGKSQHHFKFGLELDLIDDFDIDLTTYLDRTAKPREDEAGNIPEKNDYRFVVSLGYSF